MRGKDPETGEFYSESRSQRRREAIEVLDLAGQLMALSATELRAISMPDDLLELIFASQRITSNIARKRQKAFLAKAIRRESDEVQETIRAVLTEDKNQHQKEVAQMHRVENWRDRLVAEGDDALPELLELHPDIDRQQLRQWIRNAQQEFKAGKPPKSSRLIFKELKRIMLNETEQPDDMDEEQMEQSE